MTDETAPRIAHYRVVDDRLLAGAQPNQDEYVALADQGVTTVIDLRAGTRIDPNLDDAVFLADLGITYIPLPLPDGHAPSPELARTAIAQIQLAQGRVYLHCAAGVGRTTSVEMAYRAYSGMEHGVAQQLAVGPPSVEQLWFVSSLKRGSLRAVPPLVALLSRALYSPHYLLGRIRTLAAKATSRHRP